MFKKLFGGKEQEQEQEYTIDELIILKEYDRAVDKLKRRISIRNDLHDHLRLADVYLRMKDVGKAVDQFVFVAQSYAEDGFFDKGVALLQKAIRINPMDDTLQAKLQRFDRLKNLEKDRGRAIEGLRAGQAEGRNAHVSVVEFQSWWTGLSETELVHRLSGDQLAILFSAGEIRHLLTGKLLAEAGATDEALYVILRGTLEAFHGDGVAVPLTTLRTFGAGQVVGDGALFRKQTWPTTYKAREPSSLLRIDREGLERCLKGNPDPTGFLSLLRREENDRKVADILKRLR